MIPKVLQHEDRAVIVLLEQPQYLRAHKVALPASIDCLQAAKRKAKRERQQQLLVEQLRHEQEQQRLQEQEQQRRQREEDLRQLEQRQRQRQQEQLQQQEEQLQREQEQRRQELRRQEQQRQEQCLQEQQRLLEEQERLLEEQERQEQQALLVEQQRQEQQKLEQAVAQAAAEDHAAEARQPGGGDSLPPSEAKETAAVPSPATANLAPSTPVVPARSDGGALAVAADSPAAANVAASGAQTGLPLPLYLLQPWVSLPSAAPAAQMTRQVRQSGAASLHPTACQRGSAIPLP